MKTYVHHRIQVIFMFSFVTPKFLPTLHPTNIRIARYCWLKTIVIAIVLTSYNVTAKVEVVTGIKIIVVNGVKYLEKHAFLMRCQESCKSEGETE